MYSPRPTAYVRFTQSVNDGGIAQIAIALDRVGYLDLPWMKQSTRVSIYSAGREVLSRHIPKGIGEYRDLHDYSDRLSVATVRMQADEFARLLEELKKVKGLKVEERTIAEEYLDKLIPRLMLLHGSRSSN